jgi:DNA repair protein RadC
MDTSLAAVPSIVTEIKLSYHPKIPFSQLPKINDTRDAYDLLRSIWNRDTIQLIEECKVIYLNRAKRVLGISNLSVGGITGTVVDPRLILATALKTVASAIIIAHNHPSGNLAPSINDEELTHKIATAARYHDITLADHIIITLDGFYSFAQEGMLR